MHWSFGKIRRFYLRILHQLSGIALQHDLAGLEDVGAVCDGQGLLCILLYKEYVHSVSIYLLYDLK